MTCPLRAFASAFSELVLSDHVLDQLGPAVRAGRSLFVYGPPGNGKTVISQAIRNLLLGEIAVPHALVVEGSIIRFYDPVNHEAMPDAALEGEVASLDSGYVPDARWVRCRRPSITVGGELTLDSLELNYDPSSGFYRAPVQAIASGGVLVIDDFGRQHCSARDLLNRWIVPLESRVDYLTLQTGQKFELPFVVLVVFATNLRPAELVDEAFLRRIQYKVFAESPNHAEFVEIFKNYCAQVGVGFDPALVERLLVEYFRPRKIAFAAASQARSSSMHWRWRSTWGRAATLRLNCSRRRATATSWTTGRRRRSTPEMQTRRAAGPTRARRTLTGGRATRASSLRAPGTCGHPEPFEGAHLGVERMAHGWHEPRRSRMVLPCVLAAPAFVCSRPVAVFVPAVSQDHLASRPHG